MNKLSAELLPELEAHLGYWLRRVSNHVSAAFAHGLQARQISVAEWVALRHLYGQASLTPGELAQLLGMTRGAVSKVLDKLEDKGLVTGQTKPEDHRSQLLSLTPEGKRLIPALVEIADCNDRKYFGCLSTGEQATLKQLLQKLTDIHQWYEVPVD